MSWGHAIIGWLAGLDSRVWQAIIAGVFVAAGWIFNGWQNRRAARQLREEKLRDTHRAIYAEIDSNLSNLWDAQDLEDYGAQMVERMQEDAGFTPLIPRERNDRLFEKISDQIHVLPRVTIDPIVMYYSQIDAISAHVEDMRGPAFRRLTTDRKILMYLDYIEMRKTALELGRLANYLIKVFSEQGKEVAEAEAERLQNTRSNSPNAGRSDQ